MKNKNYSITKAIFSSLILGSVITNFSCTKTEKSTLRVAGGTIDGSDGVQKYQGTIYVEMRGKDFNGQEKIIKNVGTIVDVGLPDSLALILSLADAFEASNGQAVLPIFQTVSLKLNMNDAEAISLPTIQASPSGVLQDAANRTYVMLSVGIKPLQTGPVDERTAQTVQTFASKLFLESPLKSEKGVNLRDANTSFVMISLPKSAHPALARLQAPQILTAEERPAPVDIQGVVVGFGENTVPGSQKNQFQLSAAEPNVLKRNYASIEALNKSASDYTPLRALIGSAADVAKEIWEYSGSGLCVSKDGVNRDTGAAVYIAGKYAGMSVRSTSKATEFKGQLNCAATAKSDMVTLVVSPSKEHIDQFVSRAQSK